MLSLDSGEDLGGVEAAGPFRLSDLALFFFSLIFSFPSLSLDLLLALCGPVWYSPGVLPSSPLPCPFAWLSGAQVDTLGNWLSCANGGVLRHTSLVSLLGFRSACPSACAVAMGPSLWVPAEYRCLSSADSGDIDGSGEVLTAQFITLSALVYAG